MSNFSGAHHTGFFFCLSCQAPGSLTYAKERQWQALYFEGVCHCYVKQDCIATLSKREPVTGVSYIFPGRTPFVRCYM